MKRRHAIQILGSASLAPVVAGVFAENDCNAPADWTPPAIAPIVLGDSHFLSATNPSATADQITLEKQALSVMASPAIRQARAAAAERFQVLAGNRAPPEAMRDFDGRMEEWTYHYVLLAMNSDTNYPKVLHHDYGPPHEWYGIKLPGGRGPGTGENVDNAYSVFPVDGFSRYELHGKRMSPPTGDCPIHVVGSLSMSVNIAALLLRDTDIATDGTFRITVGPEPANGRRNHLQTTADSRYVFIRDGRTRWDQVPSAFCIYRMDPPTRPALTIEQKTAMAARFILDDVAMNWAFTAMINIVPPNTVAMPKISANFGGQPSQMLGRGHLKLGEDDAFLMSIDPRGSEYYTVISYDWWLMSGNYWSRQSTLNQNQSEANADGTYTYVFARRDPGVHNWIDTLNCEETLFLIRFQLLSRDTGGSFTATPQVQGKQIKLTELEAHVPTNTKRISPQQRKELLAARHAAFIRRFTV